MHYVKATTTITLFNGTVRLGLDEIIVLSPAQFITAEVTTLVTSGDLIELSEGQAEKIKGTFPVTNTDRQLTKNENVSVNTALGIVNIQLYPDPKAGYSHYLLPAENTWGDSVSPLKFPVRVTAVDPIMSDTEHYDIDISVPVFFLFVGGTIGWEVIVS